MKEKKLKNKSKKRSWHQQRSHKIFIFVSLNRNKLNFNYLQSSLQTFVWIVYLGKMLYNQFNESDIQNDLEIWAKKRNKRSNAKQKRDKNK